jgi:hypothetical protein
MRLGGVTRGTQFRLNAVHHLWPAPFQPLFILEGRRVTLQRIARTEPLSRNSISHECQLLCFTLDSEHVEFSLCYGASVS